MLIWLAPESYYSKKMSLHKELEYKEGKLKYKKLEVMQLRKKNKSTLPVGE